MLPRPAALALLTGLCLSAHAFRSEQTVREDEHFGDTDETTVQEEGYPAGEKLDVRGNTVSASVAETLWAVRVLRASTKPNNKLPPWAGRWVTGSTNMDLLWAWVQALQESDQGGIPLRLNPPMDKEAEERNTKPEEFIGAFFVGHHFKNGRDEKGREVYGMDFYILSRMEFYDEEDEDLQVEVARPNGEVDSFFYIERLVREKDFFAQRARADLAHQFIRQDSAQNNNAGIASRENLPDEAAGFFGNLNMWHSKSVLSRIDWQKGASKAKELGAPFIGGASGSILYMVLSMEDTCLRKCDKGVVPCEGGCQVREALLGIMTAALIAGGQHSLLECLEVMQSMGYFPDVKPLLGGGDYLESARGFEEYLSTLGVGVGEHEGKPMVELAKEKGQQAKSPNPTAGFKDVLKQPPK